MRAPAVLLVLALAAGPGAADKDAPDYYPLKIGTKWHYRLDLNGQTVPVENQVVKVEIVNGAPVAQVDTFLQGKVMASEQLQANAQGVFRLKSNEQEFKPAVHLLRYPAKDGESWETVTGGGAPIRYRCKAVRETVKVPAGTYQAVRVQIDADQNGTLLVQTLYWFAPEVGMVKQVFQGGPQNRGTLELEKFEPAR
jgi:hypothetical protein